MTKFGKGWFFGCVNCLHKGHTTSMRVQADVTSNFVLFPFPFSLSMFEIRRVVPNRGEWPAYVWSFSLAY